MNKILKEALHLSETILSELELSSASLTSIALKASRLARILGHFDEHQIFLYEAGGYPSSPTGLTHKTWNLAVKANRTYKDKSKDEIKEYAHVESIEQLENIVATAKESIHAARDPDISLTSANPHQYISHPAGNSSERSSLRSLIATKTKVIAQRRAYIYEYVSKVHYEVKYSSVANDIFDRIRSKVDSKIGDTIPDAVKKFTAVYDNLVSSNDEDWSNAVHSCRRILQDTADALYPSREDKVINIGGKDKIIKLGPDNYINRLIAYVEDKTESERFRSIVGSHLKYLGERLDAVFQAAQKGSHSVISTREEADRYVVYTYLVVGDILDLDESSQNKPEYQKQETHTSSSAS